MPTLTACAPELIILVGDQQQLPPFSRVTHADAPLSVLERMEAVLPRGSIKMLRTQYRMPPQICDFLSHRFYGGDLETATETRQRCQLSEPAISWHDHNERESDDGTSFYNTKEIEITCNLLASEPALACKQLAANSETVVVITFYSAQVSRLQARLASTRPDVIVMTVDAAQGCEADYVVVSCVRCNTDHNIGFTPLSSLPPPLLSPPRPRFCLI